MQNIYTSIIFWLLHFKSIVMVYKINTDKLDLLILMEVFMMYDHFAAPSNTVKHETYPKVRHFQQLHQARHLSATPIY